MLDRTGLPSRVLVTGGAGFIGSALCRELLAAGVEVRVLDAVLPAAWDGVAPHIEPGVDFVRGDVQDGDLVRRCLRGVDVVAHQAALVGLGTDLGDLPAYAGNNDLGTAVLLAEMARADITRLVLASSMVVYGEGRWDCPTHGSVRPLPRAPADLDQSIFDPRCPSCAAALEWGLVAEDAPLDPRSVYAATKAAQEHLVAAWQRITGAVAVALRYHNVYGPGMPRDTPYCGVAAIFRSALAAGRAPTLFEDGRQMRDFVEVRDVARANVAALRIAQPGMHTFNVCSGAPRSIGDMATALAAAANGPAPTVTGRYRLGDVRHIVASPQRASDLLGFSAQVSFEDGVRNFAVAPLRGQAADRRE